MNKPRIAISGATGYIGQQLLQKLRDEYQIVALHRSAVEVPPDRHIEWRQCDLFSISSIRKALEGVDVAFYLIHSMLPSTKLFQGNFADTDLILADNFVRACLMNRVKQIVYLGGLVPEDTNISHHLKSRQEVEGVLKASGIPVTILRASMVVGCGGSSFQILQNLVQNLPIMLLPRWTKNHTQTIYIDDVMRVMNCCIDNPTYFHTTIDLVNGEQLTYESLLRKTASGFKLRRLFIRFPWHLTQLSKRWVCFFGKADINLVSPLVDSLRMNLPQNRPAALIDQLILERDYEKMLSRVDFNRRKMMKNRLRRPPIETHTVRSIQRLKTCPNMSCDQIAAAYFTFLPQLFRYFIHVKVSNNKASFMLSYLPLTLLELTHIAERSDKTRHLFYITGGVLAGRTHYGWLEFRQIDHKKYTLAVIHEFTPKLPWYLYRLTQAPIHAWVMKKFSLYLNNLSSEN